MSNNGMTRICANSRCKKPTFFTSIQRRYCSSECAKAVKNDPLLRLPAEQIFAERDLEDINELNYMAHVFKANSRANHYANKYAEAISKREYLKQTISDMILANPQQQIKPLPNQVKEKSGTEKEAILLLSDWQVGKINQGIGIETLKNERIPRIMAATKRILEEYSEEYVVNKIHIVLDGDMIEGCYIYGGQNVYGLDHTYNSHRITNQMFLCAELLAQVVGYVASIVPQVVVHSVPGNHGRTNGKNDFSDPEDNFDTLVAWWAKDKCQMLENVTWNIHEAWWAKFDALGHKIVAMHGDAWRGPLTQIEKLLPQWITANTFGCIPTAVLLAHRHTFSHIEVNGIDVIQNGTIDGGSEYYLRQYGKVSKPTQALIMISKKYGVESSHPIKFDVLQKRGFV